MGNTTRSPENRETPALSQLNNPLARKLLLAPDNQPEMGNSPPASHVSEVPSQARIAPIDKREQAQGRTLTALTWVRAACTRQARSWGPATAATGRHVDGVRAPSSSFWRRTRLVNLWHGESAHETGTPWSSATSIASLKRCSGTGDLKGFVPRAVLRLQGQTRPLAAAPLQQRVGFSTSARRSREARGSAR